MAAVDESQNAQGFKIVRVLLIQLVRDRVLFLLDRIGLGQRRGVVGRDVGRRRGRRNCVAGPCDAADANGHANPQPAAATQTTQAK